MKPVNTADFNKFFYIVIFSFILILFILSGNFYYSYESKLTHKTRYNELKAISELKIDQIITWRNERIQDIEILASDLNIINNFFNLYGKINDKEKIVNHFKVFIKKINYKDILLVDKNFNILISCTGNENQIDGYLEKMIIDSTKKDEIISSDFYRCEICNKIHLDLLKPVFIDKKYIFTLILRIDPEKYLYPLIQSWPTPSKTAETLLIRKEEDKVVFLNELRHQKDSALNLKFPLTNTSLPAVQVLLGKEGYFEGYDYRNIKVLADLQKIPNTPWYMVAKVDKNEILEELNYKIFVIIIVELLIILLLITVLFNLFNNKRKKLYEQLYLTELDKKTLKAHIENLTKYANDIIILADENQKIIDANKKAETVYNYSLDEFKALSLSGLQTDESRKKFQKDIKKELNNEGKIYDTVHKKKDGIEFPVEVSARIIEIENKKFFQSIIRDISDRKKNEEIIKNAMIEKEKLLIELENKNKELESIINIISHDLRSPLINIIGFSQQLESISKELIEYLNKIDFEKDKKDFIMPYLTEKIPTSLSFIKKSFLKMDSLLKGLLHVSRTGRIQLNYTKINMNTLMNEIISDFNYKIQEIGATIILDELPDYTGDYNLINQLFSNLVDNALKYRDVKKKLIIKISATNSSDSITYIVKDTGIGIPKEYQEKVWNLFTRLTSDTSIPGEGIGLSLVLNITQKHNGKIWIESKLNKGTTFFIQLPQNKNS